MHAEKGHIMCPECMKSSNPIVSHDYNMSADEAIIASKTAYTEIAVIDGIEHVVSQEVPEGKASSERQKATARIVAVKLIADIKDQAVRDQYCQTISKLIDITAAILKTSVKEEIQERNPRRQLIKRHIH
jgi:DNA primase